MKLHQIKASKNVKITVLISRKMVFRVAQISHIFRHDFLDRFRGQNEFFQVIFFTLANRCILVKVFQRFVYDWVTFSIGDLVK